MFSASQLVESAGNGYMPAVESFTEIAELISLRFQLKEVRQALETSERSLAEQEDAAADTIQSLESLLREKDTLLKNGQAREREILLEITELDRRLAEAAESAERRQRCFREFAQHQQNKLAQLRRTSEEFNAWLAGCRPMAASTGHELHAISFFQEFECVDA